MRQYPSLRTPVVRNINVCWGRRKQLPAPTMNLISLTLARQLSGCHDRPIPGARDGRPERGGAAALRNGTRASQHADLHATALSGVEAGYTDAAR